MKKLFALIFFVLISANIYAQAPGKMSYQAVVRDANNTLITNSTVGMQISILEGNAAGPAVYVETHSPTTNANGLVSLEIGSGAVVSGIFGAIDWSASPYFIKTETDPAGGSSYTITGTSELTSVPYSFFADQAEDAEYADEAWHAIEADHALEAELAFQALQADFAGIADSADIAARAYELVTPRYAYISPGMVNLMYNGVAHGITPVAIPCVDMPDNNATLYVEFFLSIPLPPDYTSTSIDIQTLYTADVAADSFQLWVGARGHALGSDLGTWVPGPDMTIPAPAVANELMEYTVSYPTPANSRFLQVAVRRVANSPLDTNTGNLKFMGMIIQFNQ